MTTPTLEQVGTDKGSHTARPATISVPVLVTRLATFQGWYWALVPLLAIVAYLPVLRVGFLSDDMGLNRIAQSSWGWEMFLPNTDLRFYRPVGFLLTWQLPWPLWGMNPFPYHLTGLLLHAGVAFVLALWLAEASQRRWLGWLAGVLFAVFPLHMEAVAWLATQWDLWAALFMLLSMLLFNRWWKGTARWPAYFLSLLSYALGILSKESVLAFLPVFLLSAWYVRPPGTWRSWLYLLASLSPFGLLLVGNIVLRWVVWGTIRNYEGVSADILFIFWDSLVEHLRPLLSPVVAVIFGGNVVQVVAALSALAWAVGLVLYGRIQARLLVVAGAWVVLTIAPVFNLGVYRDDLKNAHFLYFTTAGYCVAAAALLWTAIRLARSWRTHLLRIGTAILVLVCVVVTWIYLDPWHTASVQAEEVESELVRLIPMQERPQGMVWYVSSVPHRYKGSWVLEYGLSRSRLLGDGRDFKQHDIPNIVRVDDVTQAPLGQDGRDSFALRWEYDPAVLRWHVNYGLGITVDSDPPTAERNTGSNLQVWDFRECDPAVLRRWQVNNASAGCQAGRGLLLRPSNADPQVTNEDMKIDPAANGDRYARIRASFAVTGEAGTPEPATDLFWAGPGEQFNVSKYRHAPAPRDGAPHVFWAFLVPTDVGQSITSLRFDPINSTAPVEVRWIAVDTVR